MAANRFRLKFMFWLDITKADEMILSEQIDELKQRRSYAKTIRDGIRLICDLRAGHTDVLFELFPWMRSELASQPVIVTESHLQQEIAQLRQLIEGQGSKPQAAISTIPGPKPLTLRQFSAPTCDDDDQDTIILKRTTSTDAGKNFLSSIMGLKE